MDIDTWIEIAKQNKEITKISKIKEHNEEILRLIKEGFTNIEILKYLKEVCNIEVSASYFGKYKKRLTGEPHTKGKPRGKAVAKTVVAEEPKEPQPDEKKTSGGFDMLGQLKNQ